ncbi:MAG: tyrosine-protein phosphatase [Gammaproteobacteria bacterium]
MKFTVCFLAFLSAAAGAAYFFELHANFHSVIPDRVYRSAQLSPDTLEKYIARYGIRSVVNLRGPNPDEEWYRLEKETTARLGVSHYDIRSTSERIPRIDQMLDFFHLYETTPKPLLIHCESGIDRTGLFSVIILLLEGKKDLTEIEKELFPLVTFFKAQNSGNLFYDKYRHWLKIKQLTHTRENFQNWVKNDYVDAFGNMRFTIDFINGDLRDYDTVNDLYTYDIDRGKEERLVVDGWALDYLNQSPLAKAEILIDQTPVSRNRYGVPRPDVAKAFGNEVFVNTGWKARHRLASIPDGCHDMSLRLQRTDGSSWTSPPKARLCVSG